MMKHEKQKKKRRQPFDIPICIVHHLSILMNKKYLITPQYCEVICQHSVFNVYVVKYVQSCQYKIQTTQYMPFPIHLPYCRFVPICISLLHFSPRSSNLVLHSLPIQKKSSVPCPLHSTELQHLL
jgi:hypothetical protein